MRKLLRSLRTRLVPSCEFMDAINVQWPHLTTEDDDIPNLLQLLKLKEQREALKLQGQKHEDTIMKVLYIVLS